MYDKPSDEFMRSMLDKTADKWGLRSPGGIDMKNIVLADHINIFPYINEEGDMVRPEQITALL